MLLLDIIWLYIVNKFKLNINEDWPDALKIAIMEIQKIKEKTSICYQGQNVYSALRLIMAVKLFWFICILSERSWT